MDAGRSLASYPRGDTGRLRELTKSFGIELALTLQAFRHLPEASTRAETQPIAANLEANAIRWWMIVGFR